MTSTFVSQALPSADLNNEARSTQKARINGYLGLSCLIFLTLIIILMPDYTRWAAVILSMSVIAIAILSMINSMLNQQADKIDRLKYKLKLTESKLDRLKIKYNDACQLDELTSCFNKQHFVGQCQRFMSLSTRSGVRFSLIVVEIDQYIEVLSLKGRRGSDELLRIFGNVLYRAVREVDVVARIEDDRFAVLLSDAVDQNVMIVTNRISKLVGQISPIENRDMHITVSVGVTAFMDQEDVACLLGEASSALDIAIGQGGDRVAVHQKDRVPQGSEAA
jgi:polar amino acid transport system substrate-binding protein